MNESFLFIAYIILNLLTFILIGEDKRRKRNYGYLRRVPESIILILSFLGGALGTLIGMEMFLHKREKESFLVLNILFMLIQFGLILHFLVFK